MNNQRIGSSLVACVCAAFISSGCGDAGAGPTSEPFAGVGEAATPDQEANSDGNQPAISDGEALFAGGEMSRDSSDEAGAMAPSHCSEICRHLAAAGCGDSDCTAECSASVSDPCFDEFVAFYDCAIRLSALSCVDGDLELVDPEGCLAEIESAGRCEDVQRAPEPVPVDGAPTTD